MHTIDEYLALTPRQQFWYRVYRSPLMMFFIGPWLQFMILERFTFDLPKTAKVARWGVWKTNLALFSVLAAVFVGSELAGFGGWNGLGRFWIIFLPTSLMSAAMGVWMFFVQHNYEEAYFKRHKEWNYATAALDGSSFYDLPQWMHWFSANIGYHHIHHLDATIPNYNLPRCHYDNPEFQNPVRIKLLESIRCVGLDLWDEENGKLVPMSAAKKRRRTKNIAA
jgi:omega-6 fatty acid desaturase (delta-12 desaturase)